MKTTLRIPRLLPPKEGAAFRIHAQAQRLKVEREAAAARVDQQVHLLGMTPMDWWIAAAIGLAVVIVGAGVYTVGLFVWHHGSTSLAVAGYASAAVLCLQGLTYLKRRMARNERS